MTATLREEGGFVPPVYPFDKLAELAELAGALPGGAVDLSIGTPCDPPAPAVVEALATSGAERGYPPALGSAELVEAVAGYLGRRFGVALAERAIAPCVGTKELVAGLPHWLRLMRPGRDSVLYPSLAYPTYEMSALLAGCRPVPVPPGADGRLDLAAVSASDAGRALCLFVNSPGNPAGQLEDLAACAAWGRERSVPVFSDECYAEFTWDGPPRSVLQHASEGVVAVHSLSKRSNMAGLRVGFVAGDPHLVGFLKEVRRHQGLMVPGPVQAAGAAALADDRHVEAQRERYLERLVLMAGVLNHEGFATSLPPGGFYLWSGLPTTVGDAWEGAELLARRGGLLTSPGDLYGPEGAGHLRVAVVQPTERLALAAQRLGEPAAAS